MIEIKETTIEEAYKIHLEIPEFTDPGYDLDLFKEKIKGVPSLVIVGLLDGRPAGYLVGYERWLDRSFYCWMAGVKKDERRNGILNSLMEYQSSWALKNHYKSIKIKTRNQRREMLSYLIKSGFNLLEVEPKTEVNDNVILLEKQL